MAQRSFPILGGTYQVSDQRDQYNEAHHQFKALSIKIAREFIELFNSNCRSLDDLIDKSGAIAAKVYMEAAGEIAGMLAHMGIYSLDKNTIYSQYLTQDSFNIWLTAMRRKRDAINNGVDEKNAERAENFANRTRVHSYDVYVGDPMADTLVAGAADLTIGAASAAANLIGAGLSAIGASIEKSELFKDPKTVKTLYIAVEDDIYSCIDEYMEAVEDNGKGEFDPVDEEEANHAENLVNNLMDGHIPEDKRKELILEALSNDPYNIDIFMYAYKEYGDENGEITTVAQYLYHDADDMKEDIVSDIIDGDITSEEVALEKREQVIAAMKRMSAKSSHTLGLLNKLLEDFEEAAHHYRGHRYDTRAECDAAKAQDKELAEKCAFIFGMDHETAVKLSIEMSESDFYPQIKMPYINAVSNHIANLENADLNIVCTTMVPIADKAVLLDTLADINGKGYVEETVTYYTDYIKMHIENRDDLAMFSLCAPILTCDEPTAREIERQVKEADIEESVRTKYLGIIDDRIKVIWAEEDGRSFRDVIKNTNVFDAASIQASIAHIEANGRTEAKQEFIEALKLFTPENIATAQKYSKNKSKGFLNTFVLHAAFSIKNKNMWDTITVRNTVIHSALVGDGSVPPENEYTAPPLNGKAAMKALPGVPSPKRLHAVKSKKIDIIYPKDDTKPVKLSALDWDSIGAAELSD